MCDWASSKRMWSFITGSKPTEKLNATEVRENGPQLIWTKNHGKTFPNNLCREEWPSKMWRAYHIPPFLLFAVHQSSIYEHHNLEITGSSFHLQIFGFHLITLFLSGITKGNDWDKLYWQKAGSLISISWSYCMLLQEFPDYLWLSPVMKKPGLGMNTSVFKPWNTPELKFSWRIAAPLCSEASSGRMQHETTPLQNNILKATHLKIWKSFSH